MSPNDPSVFWTDSIDYLKHVNISYVYEIIKKSTELNSKLIEELKVRFESESAEMPFCNLGDVDLDDLENDLPKGWTLRREKTDLKQGEAMVVLAVIDYSAERYFDVDDYEEVEIVAYDLGGCYPLSVDSDENPFMEDYQTSASKKTISLVYCEEEGIVDTAFSCPIEKFSDSCNEWREFIDSIQI